MLALRAIAPVGKYGDLTAAKGALTMHQAALTVTVFGRRVSKKEFFLLSPERAIDRAKKTAISINNKSKSLQEFA
ncbi:MAG: hypothetical protein ACR2QH_18070 [Geminicoccaceae bacterium]